MAINNFGFDPAALADFLAKQRGAGIQPSFTNIGSPDSVGPNQFFIDAQGNPQQGDPTLTPEQQAEEDRISAIMDTMQPNQFTTAEAAKATALELHQFKVAKAERFRAQAREQAGLPQLYDKRDQLVNLANMGFDAGNQQLQIIQGQIELAEAKINRDLIIGKDGTLAGNKAAQFTAYENRAQALAQRADQLLLDEARATEFEKQQRSFTHQDIVQQGSQEFTLRRDEARRENQRLLQEDSQAFQAATTDKTLDATMQRLQIRIDATAAQAEKGRKFTREERLAAEGERRALTNFRYMKEAERIKDSHEWELTVLKERQQNAQENILLRNGLNMQNATTEFLRRKELQGERLDSQFILSGIQAGEARTAAELRFKRQLALAEKNNDQAAKERIAAEKRAELRMVAKEKRIAQASVKLTDEGLALYEAVKANPISAADIMAMDTQTVAYMNKRAQSNEPLSVVDTLSDYSPTTSLAAIQDQILNGDVEVSQQAVKDIGKLSREMEQIKTNAVLKAPTGTPTGDAIALENQIKLEQQAALDKYVKDTKNKEFADISNIPEVVSTDGQFTPEEAQDVNLLRTSVIEALSAYQHRQEVLNKIPLASFILTNGVPKNVVIRSLLSQFESSDQRISTTSARDLYNRMIDNWGIQFNKKSKALGIAVTAADLSKFKY